MQQSNSPAVGVNRQDGRTGSTVEHESGMRMYSDGCRTAASGGAAFCCGRD
ncbi:hypothetical protein [Paenibacillus sp. FSL E2-0178]|uniref:hypothetical protein n=1 Tax=Paenibacillus sp. FSL E2-0178 TaxID=2921361 RepID=UPI0031598FF4